MNYSQARICVEKLSNAFTDKISPHHSPSDISKLKAAFLKQAIWQPNAHITIGFFPILEDKPAWTPIGSMKGKLDPLESEVRSMDIVPAIKRVISERIIPLVSLNIEFIPDVANAMVRVGFDTGGGAWAYVGTDQLQHKDPSESTVNFGWLDVGTIIHEFCHVIGMIHEHQNTRGKTIDWNPSAVYAWAEKTQGWDKATTDVNILDKYQLSQLNGSDFDPLSIMLYFFPAELTNNNQGTKQNLIFSGEDVEWINNTYKSSRTEPPEVFYPKIYGISLQKAIEDSNKLRLEYTTGKSKTNLYMWLFLVGMALAIISGIVWYYKRKYK